MCGSEAGRRGVHVRAGSSAQQRRVRLPVLGRDLPFTLRPRRLFRTRSRFVWVNSTFDLDGTDEASDGAFLRFAPGESSFTFAAYGCEPHVRVKLDYALSGDSCLHEQTITGRTSFTVPAPVIDAAGNCTVPAL